ncbi:MAG: RagB/SusD family nutrient uptake outer membrane protein [Prolixibacteraceae bacterium]|jgi:hypothetical protein|nr:RagB/SusD family nutrient uptake outer membrane protein [Prolixibacteraceae bacterium]
MKNIVLSFITLATFLIAGCTDEFLNTVSPNDLVEEVFWGSESDVKLAITGCYAVLQSTDLFKTTNTGTAGLPGLDFASDNGYMTWSYMAGGELPLGNYQVSGKIVDGVWKACYKGVARCNYLLSNISEVSETELAPEKRARYIAEAKFLRAMYYKYLEILYRDVPLITETQKLSEANVPKNSRSEIVETITNDLKTCAEDLPAPGELAPSEWGRATKGAAYALLADIYLNDHQYSEAAIYAKKVLDMNYYELFPDYATLFSKENEQCKEIIFSACFKRGLGGYGSTFGWYKQGTSRVPDNHHPLKNLADEFYCTDGLSITESPLYNTNLEITNRDVRFNTTLISKGSQWHTSTVPEAQLALTGYATRKWTEELGPNITLDQTDCDQDFYIFRLAHVILDRAEALVQAGSYSETEVIGLIDMIRTRANMPKVENVEGAGLSKNKLMEIIMHERRVETAFEARRYLDLRRWGKLKERTDWYNNNEYVNNPKLGLRIFIEPKMNIWPIPQVELDVNKALVQHEEWQ